MARRRPTREPAFGSDSFLDVVANLVGIVLIIIVLVGARIRELPNLEPPPEHERVQLPDDAQTRQLATEIDGLEAQLARLQQRLLEALKGIDLAATQTNELGVRRRDAAARTAELNVRLEEQERLSGRADEDMAALLMDRRALETRIAELQRAIRELENSPLDRRALRFHLPVSRPVSAGELLFELRGGRVTFIDLQAFLDEVKQTLPEKVEPLRKQWQVSGTTEPIGAFRLSYVIARERTGLDRAADSLAPTQERGFSYGLDTWELVPVLTQRGETLEEALAENSRFRQVVDGTDADQVVLTFFVYEDSFDLYRRLRDVLYDRGFMVAGRPLTLNRAIAGSRSGTTSRGQ